LNAVLNVSWFIVVPPFFVRSSSGENSMINGLLLCRNNRETIYGLLGSHGDTENLVYLAEALQDTDRLIQYNLRYGIPFSTAITDCI
jgi:hypothetical protein